MSLLIITLNLPYMVDELTLNLQKAAEELTLLFSPRPINVITSFIVTVNTLVHQQLL